MRASFASASASVLVLVACGNNDNVATPDGSDGSVDDAAATDGDTPDGPAVGVVDVFAVGYTGNVFGPLVNIPVVTWSPDGTVASTQYTDANGHVAAIIEPRSLVGVINGEHRSDQHIDAAIASPGQTLRFGGRIEPSTPIGTLSLSWPVRVFPGYTVYYDVITPCGGYETTATTMQIQLTQECAPGPFDVAVTSRRSSEGESAWMLRRGVVPAPNVTVSFADGGATWNFVDWISAAVANEPTGFESATCFAAQYLGQRQFNSDTANLRQGLCELPFMPGGDTIWRVVAGWRRSANNVRVAIEHSFPDDTAVIDAAPLLPWPTSLQFTPSTREVTWTSAPTPMPAPLDASRLQLNTLDHKVSWQIWFPDGLPSSWSLPSLPVEFADWDFSAIDTAQARLLNTDVVGEPASYLLEHDFYAAPVVAGQIVLTSEIASD